MFFPGALFNRFAHTAGPSSSILLTIVPAYRGTDLLTSLPGAATCSQGSLGPRFVNTDYGTTICSQGLWVRFVDKDSGVQVLASYGAYGLEWI